MFSLMNSSDVQTSEPNMLAVPLHMRRAPVLPGSDRHWLESYRSQIPQPQVV